MNSFFYALNWHNIKKQKTKRKRQQFPRLTSIQQYPFDSSKQQIVKWTRIPLPLPEKHQNMRFYQLWMSICYFTKYFLAFIIIKSTISIIYIRQWSWLVNKSSVFTLFLTYNSLNITGRTSFFHKCSFRLLQTVKKTRSFDF